MLTSHHGISHSHMNEQTITTYNITNESHKHNYVEQEKNQTQELLLYDYTLYNESKPGKSKLPVESLPWVGAQLEGAFS